MFDDVLGAAHDHCRDAVFFEVASNRTHGLMTHRSIGDDDGNVAAVFTYSLVYFGTIDFHRPLLTAVRRRAVEAFRDATDHAFAFQPLKLLQREPGSHVFRRRMIAIDAYERL